MATIFDNIGDSSIVMNPGAKGLYDNFTLNSNARTATPLTKTTPSGQILMDSKGVNMNVAGSGGTGLGKGLFEGIDWAKVQDAAASAGFNIIGNLAYNTSGRKTTKAGEALHSMSSIASMIPVLGPGAGALMNIVGGFLNSTYGSYVNDAEVDAMKTRIHNYSTNYSSPSNNEQLLQDFATTGGMDFITNKNIDSEGSKATKITAELNDQIGQANRGRISHMIAAANTLDSDYDKNMRANFSAFGGNLMTNGATWDNGITYVGSGGSHESNPHEGVQVGVDPQGIPNLVEEGEVIWDDYVFSKRLKVPKTFKDKYNLKKKDSLSFAEAAEKLAEESKERPNDPISKRGRDAMLSSLKDQQEQVRLKMKQRQAKAQFNKLSPEEQLGIMQMAQQQGAMIGPEGDVNNMYQEAPLMAAFGGRIFAGGGLKSYKNKADIEKNLPWLKSLYVTDLNDTKAWDALFDANDNIIATKGGTIGLYDPNGAYMKALRSLSADNWSRWSDEQKQRFVTNLKTINPTKYNNYTIDNVGKDAWSWDNLIALASDGYVGGHHQVAQFANEITSPTPARKTANRFFLRDKDANGNPIATPLTNLPDMYKGYSNTTGQTWDEVISSKGFTRVGNPQKSTVGDTDYTDYFLQRKAPVSTSTPQEDTKIIMPLDLQQTASRYTPIVGSAVGVLTDALGLTNTPDFSSAEAIERASERTGTPSLIRAQSIGNRLAYTPFNNNYYATRIAPQTKATAENIMESAAGNPAQAMAGLLALDRNSADQMGDLFRKAEEFNLEQRAKVAEFNKATDIFNAQQALTADRANQQEKRQAAASYAAGIAQAEALKQRAKQYADTNRSTNLTNFLQGLGDIGNENEQRNWLKTLYATSYFGNSPLLEQVLYNDKDIIANYLRNNKDATPEEIAENTFINKRTVDRIYKRLTKSNKKSK